MLATFWIARSKLGYAFVAIRENEEAAQSLGISPTRYKIAAWAIERRDGRAPPVRCTRRPTASSIRAIAFAIDNNVFPIAMTILGGMGTASGPFIGALLLAGINEVLQTHFPKLHTLFFGAVIVLIVLYLPRGIMYLIGLRGGLRRYQIERRAFRA